MNFLNRTEELRLLRQSMNSERFQFIACWGRRRVGKTRLLLEAIKQTKGVYWVADQSNAPTQRANFAECLNAEFPGFSDMDYPDWKRLLTQLAKEIKYKKWKGVLVVDEFPYLVANAPELPSVLQNWIDHEVKDTSITFVLSGSSQTMMQGALLDETAPLYGRATTLLKINPLKVDEIGAALKLKTARQQVESYCIWGGVPRYWELVEEYKDDLNNAIDDLVLSERGILHQEPQRLLLDEIPSAIGLRPILDAIGKGVHKLSEIAARTEIKATSLTRPISRLIELGYVRKEIPFGEHAKDSKKTLYKIDDPFLRFWFTVVAPRLYFFAESGKSERVALMRSYLPHIFSQGWEDLCRSAFRRLDILSDADCLPAQRFWEADHSEWDLLSYSKKTNTLYVGECKWTVQKPTQAIIQESCNQLLKKGLPKKVNASYAKVKYCLFFPEIPENVKLGKDVHLIDAEAVIRGFEHFAK